MLSQSVQCVDDKLEILGNDDIVGRFGRFRWQCLFVERDGQRLIVLPLSFAQLAHCNGRCEVKGWRSRRNHLSGINFAALYTSGRSIIAQLAFPGT